MTTLMDHMEKTKKAGKKELKVKILANNIFTQTVCATEWSPLG